MARPDHLQKVGGVKNPISLLRCFFFEMTMLFWSGVAANTAEAPLQGPESNTRGGVDSIAHVESTISLFEEEEDWRLSRALSISLVFFSSSRIREDLSRRVPGGVSF